MCVILSEVDEPRSIQVFDCTLATDASTSLRIRQALIRVTLKLS